MAEGTESNLIAASGFKPLQPIMRPLRIWRWGTISQSRSVAQPCQRPSGRAASQWPHRRLSLLATLVNFQQCPPSQWASAQICGVSSSAVLPLCLTNRNLGRQHYHETLYPAGADARALPHPSFICHGSNYYYRLGRLVASRVVRGAGPPPIAAAPTGKGICAHLARERLAYARLAEEQRDQGRASASDSAARRVMANQAGLTKAPPSQVRQSSPHRTPALMRRHRQTS